jgi:7-carboxy-7-deazaguanine synthase
MAGLASLFVRFGGCDFRCSWCDSMHAVEPALVRKNGTSLTAKQILARLRNLANDTWVTLTGGNPALFELGSLVATLQEAGYKVAVETQGTIYKEWMNNVNVLTVSPKPPSSGMPALSTEQLHRFTGSPLSPCEERTRLVLKVVVFDDADYDYARSILTQYVTSARVECFLSIGTHLADDRDAICERFRRIAGRLATDDRLRHVRVLPQLHVLLWGHVQGV